MGKYRSGGAEDASAAWLLGLRSMVWSSGDACGPQAGALISSPCQGGDVVLSRAAVVLLPVFPGSRQERGLLMAAAAHCLGGFIPRCASHNEPCRQEPRARTGSSILRQHRQAAQTVLEVAKNRCERDASKDYLRISDGKLSEELTAACNLS